MKKEMRREGEAPHYLKPTAASLALNQMTQKKEEKKKKHRHHKEGEEAGEKEEKEEMKAIDEENEEESTEKENSKRPPYDEVDGIAIKKKYNSSAAALYREMCLFPSLVT